MDKIATHPNEALTTSSCTVKQRTAEKEAKAKDSMDSTNIKQ